MQLTDTKTYKYPRHYLSGLLDSIDMLSDVKLIYTIAEGSEFPLLPNSIKKNHDGYSIQRISEYHISRNKNVSVFNAAGRLLYKTKISNQNISDNKFIDIYRKLPQQIYFLKIIDDEKYQIKKANTLNGPK